jgi:hypothetical protein
MSSTLSSLVNFLRRIYVLASEIAQPMVGINPVSIDTGAITASCVGDALKLKTRAARNMLANVRTIPSITPIKLKLISITTPLVGFSTLTLKTSARFLRRLGFDC